MASTSMGTEITIPKEAMPTMSEAPVATLYVAAIVGAAPAVIALPNAEKSDGWTKLALASQVSFEPWGELRAAIFAAHQNAYLHWNLGELSYHPAKPEILTDVAPSDQFAMTGKEGPGRSALATTDYKLFEEVAKVEGVRLGAAKLSQSFLVIIRDNAPVEVVDFPSVRGTKRKGENLEVFGYDEGGFVVSVGTYVPPRWRVLSVPKSGEVKEISDEGEEYIGMWDSWDDPPEATADPNWTKLVLKGKRKKKPKTITWQWDEKAGQYTGVITPASQVHQF
jgi:hypothetical protein